MESLNSNSQERERVASVATNARQRKGKLHDIFSATSFISPVVTKCSRTKSDEHITSSSSGSYIIHVVNAYIRPANDQVPSVEVHSTAQHNVLANEQHHTDQSEPSSTWSLNVYEMVKLTPGYISSGLVHNSVSPTPYVPLSKKEYEIMFQPLFDEYFNPLLRTVSPDSAAVVALRAVDPADSPLSTTIDQDVPSASTSPTIRKFNLKSLIKSITKLIFEGVEFFDKREFTKKQAGNVQTSLTLSSAKLEIQSMVDVPIHQEDPAVQRTPLINTIISMVTNKTTSTPTPPTTEAHVQICSTSCEKYISRGV
uniref:Uncharacterized protein n=1 Tax=Tanacetum cinerariifolium TaxID=118510 RepID=A0A699HJ15_TANCI|nr:hypothetical protein [Tanacetum cinerariifolium]